MGRQPSVKIRTSRRRGRRLNLPLLLIPAAALAVAGFFLLSKKPAELPPAREPASLARPEPPAVVERKETVSRGTTLAEILKGHGFTDADVHALREAVKPVYDLGRIRAGNTIRLVLLPDGAWSSIEYDIDENRYLVVRKTAGEIHAEIRYFPYEVLPAVLWTTVDDNPIAAVNEAGEGDILALQLAELFGWDIDFNTDIQTGDRVKILYEKRRLYGEFKGYGNILAAEFVNQGRVFRAFRFVYPDTGAADYFDAEGNSLRKEFLRSPFKFAARITSRFSRSRFHPIRKTYRPHYGTDYAAPIGHPVQATADGTIVTAGWNGASGRMIRIRHANAYETLYLHLRGFAPGIRAEARVQGGQVIGYVGSSGESTGPHLDYRIIHHGQYINPQSWRFKPVEPLRKEFREAYAGKVAELGLALEAPAIYLNGFLPFSAF